MNQTQRTNQNLPQKNGEQIFMEDVLRRALQAQIVTPEDYAMENAIKSAYLYLYRENLLKRCSQDSIANAVLDMVVQGLSPVKDQCYFIPYGNVLKLTRSYMGSIAVLKRFDANVADVNAEVIYGGDDFNYEIKNGVKCNIKHKQDFTNRKNNNIVGAYATAVDHNGKEIISDIMTWEELLESWKRSQRNKDGGVVKKDGTLNERADHAKQPARFARRTVINRLCKQMISATDDHALMRSYKKSDEEQSEQEMIQVEIQEQANKKLIDFDAAVQRTQETYPDFTEEQAMNATVGSSAADIEIIDSEPMATEDQIKELYAIEKANNRADQVLDNVGSFINRKIAGLSELTNAEITDYIDMLKDEQKHAMKKNEPDWK